MVRTVTQPPSAARGSPTSLPLPVQKRAFLLPTPSASSFHRAVYDLKLKRLAAAEVKRALTSDLATALGPATGAPSSAPLLPPVAQRLLICPVSCLGLGSGPVAPRVRC